MVHAFVNPTAMERILYCKFCGEVYAYTDVFHHIIRLNCLFLVLYFVHMLDLGFLPYFILSLLWYKIMNV